MNPVFRSSQPVQRTNLVRQILVIAICWTLISPLSAAKLVYEGASGSGHGKHIVFVAGDHEYRSEESLPALGRILAKHHGFKCTVLFNVDPESGEIVAGTPSNIPHMEALETADLAVVFLRLPAHDGQSGSPCVQALKNDVWQ